MRVLPMNLRRAGFETGPDFPHPSLHVWRNAREECLPDHYSPDKTCARRGLNGLWPSRPECLQFCGPRWPMPVAVASVLAALADRWTRPVDCRTQPVLRPTEKAISTVAACLRRQTAPTGEPKRHSPRSANYPSSECREPQMEYSTGHREPQSYAAAQESRLRADSPSLEKFSAIDSASSQVQPSKVRQPSQSGPTSCTSPAPSQPT